MPAAVISLRDYRNGGTASGGAREGAPADDDYDLGEFRRQFLDFSESKRPELEEQREARHYYHCDQWTPEEIKVLKKRRQPVHTDNQVGPLIDGVVGLLERLRQDPKAFPRTPRETQGADLATATLRYVMDAADWTAISAESARNGAINGIGGLELQIVPGDNGDPDLDFALIEPETFFYDPRSIKQDFADARFMGIAKWVDLDVAKEMFPDQAETLDGLISQGGDWGSLSQRDREQRWLDTNLRRVFLVEHWHIKDGQWRFCFYTGNTKLKSGVSPFRDEKGKSASRYVAWSAYVDHDGDRYGLVRNLKSDQDELNTTHSRFRHILASRRIVQETGAVDDIEKARVEAARPDGVLSVNRGFRFDLDDASKYPDLTATMNLMERAKANMEGRAPNASLIGDSAGKNQSGRAIALLQQAGLAKMGPLLLAYRNWKIRVYRAVWNAVRQFWTAERWIRITDDEGAPQFVGLNQVRMDPMTGQPQMVNQIGALDVDIILDEGPDSINLMADTLDTLERMAANGTPIPPQVVIELTDMPGDVKRKVLGMLEQAQAPNPLAQQAAEIDLAGKAADVEKTQSETMKNKADVAVKVAEAVYPPPPPRTSVPQRVPGAPAMGDSFLG